MEKLSFLKYIKGKEKQLLKYKNLLEQTGGNLDLKDLQAELLKIKIKLDTFSKAKQSKLLNPYNELKPLIDTINKKIENIDSQIKTLNSTDEIEKNRLINEIKEISFQLEGIDTAASNYTSVQVDNKVEFLKEKIDPKVVSDLFNKYINDTKGLVQELIQIGGIDSNGNTLINNDDIYNKVVEINKKIKEYESAIKEIDTKIVPIDTYITEMESLIKNVKINDFKPVENNEKEKIRIEQANERNTTFTYFDVSGNPNYDELQNYDEKQLVDPTSVFDEDHKKLMNQDNQQPPAPAQRSNTPPAPAQRPNTPPAPRINPPPAQRINPPPAPAPAPAQRPNPPPAPGQRINPPAPAQRPNPPPAPGQRINPPPVPAPGQRPNVPKNLSPMTRNYAGNQKYFIEQTQVPLSITDDSLNNKIVNLYQKWRKNLVEKKEEKENLLDFIKLKEQMTTLKNKFTNFNKNVAKVSSIVIIPNLKNLTDELVKSQSQITSLIESCNKEAKECNVENLNILNKTDGNIDTALNLIKTELNKLEFQYNSLTIPDDKTRLRMNKMNPLKAFLKEFEPKQILVGGAASGSGKAEMNTFISSVGDFEVKIRDMILKRKEIIKKIKKYNVRYTQFIAFQKYIVNYVSLTIAQESYDYYQFISKGTISFYNSVLEKMENVINKFEDPKEFNSPMLQQKENVVLYNRHYFMIKMLSSFFDKLYKHWDEKFKTDKASWSLSKKIDIGENNPNKKYYFLFNIFFKFLDAYHMNLPPVANYLRINDVIGVAEKPRNEVYRKNDKHTIDAAFVSQQCGNLKTDLDKDRKINAVQEIKFEEVFDPENFKENANLSLYMGLSNSLADKKSIMLLTYGYSGVGKTFTLFGSSKPGQTPLPGLLQTTLKNITDYTKIEMKAFELYGLGVPYKFYWERKPELFDHRIYIYDKIKGTEGGDPSEKTTQYFKDVLESNNSYITISDDQINKFSEITESIDKHRKLVGRIRPTVNNPESSRSIMIYDFKITFSDLKSCKFVIMDLPGKENLYQTYCTQVVGKEDNYKPLPIYSGKYNLSMIKSMMYINPMWLASIPEIAEHFDNTTNEQKWDAEKFPNQNVNYRAVFGKQNSDQTEFAINESNNAHKQTGLLNNLSPRTDNFKDLSSKQKAILSLYGLQSRSFNNILDYIKDNSGKSNLFALGDKINKMLPEGEQQDKKYGYAGLEGIYINENILGLLEVLAEKIQKKKNPKLQPSELKSVVCSQKEIYKKLFSSKTIVRGTNNYAEDDEFYSQIMFMNKFLNPYANKDLYEKTDVASSKKINKMTTGYETFEFEKQTYGLSKNIEDNKNNWINNYDYNSIFNIKTPPIKSILQSYLSDNSFSNFYMFFVVSNNLKVDGSKNIDTCDKQLQLLYDTRVFMDIIANDKAAGISCSV